MSFIVGLLEKYLLDWLWGRISELISSYRASKAARDEIEAKNKADREKNEAAKTKEERDEAAKSIIDHF